jgi:hypothetical protein
VTRVSDRVEQLLAEAREAMALDHDGIAIGLIMDAVKLLAAEHSSTAHMAATVDPGLLGRVTELERLTGMLVKSVGVLASSPQARAVGQVLPTTSLDREDRPATYGPVPSPYGRPSPAWVVDVCGRVLSASSPNRLADDSHYAVEDASVEYLRGEPTLRVQVSGVLYRFRAPDVLTSKEDK